MVEVTRTILLFDHHTGNIKEKGNVTREEKEKAHESRFRM